MAKQTYYVNGMHCPACEINIERVVKKIKNLKSVKASLSDSKLTLTAEKVGDLPSIQQLNANLKKYGYEVSLFPESSAKSKQNIKDVVFATTAFFVFAGLFVLIGGSDFLSGIYVSPESNAAAFFGFGVAAGISSCAALVGGLLLTVQSNWLGKSNQDSGNKYAPFILFNASRLITFALLGGLLGVVGSSLKISISGSAVLTILVSILMILIGLQMLGIKGLKGISFNPFRRVFNSSIEKTRAGTYSYPILVGAITFFIPCGFTIIAQTQAIASGSFQMGFLSLGAFALGTLPILALISFTSVKLYSHPRFSNMFQVFSGLMIIFFALFTINGQFGVLGLPTAGSVLISEKSDSSPEENWAPEIADSPSAVKGSQDVQIMQMEVKGFEYFPKVIHIKANTPTRLEITDNGSIGCARAVYPRGLYDGIINLSPGLNTVEFTSPAAGAYQVSCSMWMVEPISVIVE